MDGRIHLGYHGLHLTIDAVMPIPLNQEAYLNMLQGDGGISDPSLKLMWGFVEMIDELIPIGILASNISYPGALRCSSGEIRVGSNVLVSTPECANYLAEYLDDARQLGWPKEIPVSFKQAVQWVTRTLERSPHVGSDRVSRALSAFSHIAASSEFSSSSLTLFWAMMGLESLYCDGYERLKKQIFDKASVLFGPLTDNKKVIRSLYDFRSAFVHGSTNIPYAFCDDYESDDVNSFHADVHKSQSIAFLLLIVSLQWLVKSNKDNLTFEYRIT